MGLIGGKRAGNGDWLAGGGKRVSDGGASRQVGEGVSEGFEELVSVGAAERERGADLEGVAERAGGADQDAAVAHAVDDGGGAGA